jgi:hypothetical protein
VERRREMQCIELGAADHDEFAKAEFAAGDGSGSVL